MSKHKDLTAQRFGRLTVIKRGENDSAGRATWACLCDCGQSKSGVKSAGLLRGETRSCGCLGRETRRQNGIKVGQAQVHSFSKSAMLREYRCWESMIARCHNPKANGFHRYGGRGIAVCDAWRASFEQFARDMGPRPPGHSIERIDNDGPYNPSNCRWATRTEQANNRRTSRLLTANGKTRTIADWARETGLSWHTLYHRVDRGWSADAAVNTPLHGSGQR